MDAESQGKMIFLSFSGKHSERVLQCKRELQVQGVLINAPAAINAVKRPQ